MKIRFILWETIGYAAIEVGACRNDDLILSPSIARARRAISQNLLAHISWT